MVTVRLNDINIRIQDNNIVIEDLFNDITPKEVSGLVKYLILEGFVNEEDELQVFVRKKRFNEVTPETKPTED